MQIFGDILRFQRKSNVFVNGKMRVKCIALEHHGDAALTRREIVHHFSADKDFAGRGRFQAGDHAQESRFPRARRPQENQKLAFARFQVDFVYSSELSFFKYLGQLSGFNDGHQSLR